jgi:metal-responsive CopG/Arc/MetJ family transcriptional regulator
VKTAISIPDEVFLAADELARRLGISRSELYATAVAEYIAEHRATGVKERLDALYGMFDSQLDESVEQLQDSSLPREDW